MIFSDKTINKAIKSLGNELAWKKEDVYNAIDELIENKCAILGGDVWAVVKNNDNLPVLLQVDAENIAVGIIRGKDGQDYVYNWYSEKRQGESWDEYVLRSKVETIESITKMDAEQTVAEEFKNYIYYNLVFANNVEFENLKQ